MSREELQRARGDFSVRVTWDAGRSRLEGLRQQGCSRVLFPSRTTGMLEAVTVNLSGGVAAGDVLRGAIHCGPGAALLMTSQAAERIYRARPGDSPAEIDVSVRLDAGARLEWLPHETIFFDGCALRRDFRIVMDASAEFLAVESRVFGRTGFGEEIASITLADRLHISRDGVPVLVDALRFDGALNGLLSRPAAAGGGRAVTTLVWLSPDAEAALATMREALGGLEGAEAAASAWNGMLVVRGNAPHGRAAWQMVRRLLGVIRRGQPEPATWRS